MGLPTNENHLVYKWSDGNILFSMTKRGKAASCHFASDSQSIRGVKDAINEFVPFVFKEFKWCKMVLAVICRPSIERIVGKCGFEEVTRNENAALYVRVKK